MNFAKQVGTEIDKCRSEKNLAIRGPGVPLPHACFCKAPDDLRPFECLTELLRYRHTPVQIEVHLPGFGRCVRRPHAHIIPSGGTEAIQGVFYSSLA